MDSMKKGITEDPNNNRWNQASIANYLRHKGYDYTLSVFLAESEVSPDNIYAKAINDKSLFDKNSDSNKMLLQVWEKLEQKYNDLLKQRVQKKLVFALRIFVFFLLYCKKFYLN